MAYLSEKNFEHDAFISYSRVDNLENWVTTFNDRLNIKLKMLSGQKSIDVWRDPKISDNEVFDPVINNTLEKTALFLSLTSPSYNESLYCKKELSYFHTYVQKPNDLYGLVVENKCRVFNIRLYDRPNELWPKELKGRTGYKFFDNELPMPLDPESPEYNKNITILANDIWVLLTLMKQKQHERKFVLLASVPNSLGFFREQLQMSLGKTVRLEPSEKDIPQFENKNLDKILECLEKSCSSIHLIDEESEEPEKTYYRWEAETAVQTNKPQLVWYPKTLPDNSPQKKFIDKLYASKKKELEVIPGNKPDIPNTVSKWVEKYTVDPPPPTDYWLLDADPDDTENIEDINTELHQLNKEQYNYQNADDIIEAVKKVKHYIMVINKYPHTCVHRLNTILKIIPQLPPGCKLGIYISPDSYKLNDEQIEFIKNQKENNFKIYDAIGYGIGDDINSLGDFLRGMS